MKKSLIALAVTQLAMPSGGRRARTRDISFSYRMPVGFPGDVDRTHPFSVVPGNMDTTNPAKLYGDPVIVNTSANTYRGLIASDTGVTKIAGILVRPYPVSQTTGGMSASVGAATPPTGPAVIDVLNEGFMIVKCNNVSGTNSTKGSAVYIWVAADSGNHKQGGFEAASSGSTITITNALWDGPCDTTTGIGRIQVMAPGA